MKIWQAAIYILLGLAGLVIGGNWIVDGASGIAARAGLTESMIGLTVVAIGSSVPDLATSSIAALKKQAGIAMGNLIGACTINVFLVIGLCATVRPMVIGQISFVDYMTLIGGSFLIWLIPAFAKSRSINRFWGIVLCALYVAYMTYVIIFQAH